ncbi:N-formylglutamate amidohydrolase [bacterium BMS3Abin07]|nr:N-formylglutamate amidohydrolase [bacterium BMS3Abin07]
MNIIAVLHIPHSSDYIPAEERENILLSDELLASEVLKMTDWYADELFTSGSRKCEVVRYPVSRLVLDPERFEDDAWEIMASRGMGVIYTKTSEGETLRHVMDSAMRKRMLEKYYAPHHAHLSQVVSSILSKNGKALVIDCHSFPSSPLPYEIDQCKNRPDVCFGTDPYHTPVWLREFTKADFIKQGFSVNINRPFSGALVPVEYFQKEPAVSGIMIEINRRLYMDERTGKRLSDFENVKRTISGVVSELTKHYGNCGGPIG